MSLSDSIAQKISNELNLDKDKSEVISYGAFALIHITINLFFVALFGLIFGVFYEAMVISFTSSILRKSSGGVHASRPSTCVAFGTFVTVTLAVIVNIAFNYISNLLIIISGTALFAWSYYTIFKKAPVDSKAKPINSPEKRSRMKKKSLRILTSYFIIIIILALLSYFTQNEIYLLYSICIYSGFSWQVFTLTIIGHHALHKIDNMFNYIFFKKRR
jgi:accessory gene regulator B